jgi:hypothetical protein
VKRVLQAAAAALAAGGFSFGGAWLLSTGLQRLFPPEALGPSAAAGVFDGSKPQWYVVWLAAIAGPLYETLLAQAAPLEMTRLLKAPWAIGIALSAVLFGAAHWIGGGIGHAVVTLFMGTVFAAMYVAFRRDGWPYAYGVAAGTHAVHNTLSLLLVH